MAHSPALKATVWDVIWTPWGAPHTITGAQTLEARFPGQWFQLEAGLHYNWHRHYDPSLGRYTQPDPLGFVDGPSVYAYVSGSPLHSIDSTGLIRSPPQGFTADDLPDPPTNCWDASALFLLNCAFSPPEQCEPDDDCPEIQSKLDKLVLCASLKKKIARCNDYQTLDLSEDIRRITQCNVLFAKNCSTCQ